MIHTPLYRRILPALLLCCLLSTVALAQEATPETGTDAIPPEVAGSAAWPLANHDYRNTRATTESDINSQNADALELAWQFPIPGVTRFGAAASAPLIVDGVVYFQDFGSNVFALDLQTGALIWEHRYENTVAGPNGIGIGYGKIFAASSDHTFAALDAATGEELWSTDTTNPTGAIQPSVYDGLVYMTTQSETLEDAYASGRSGQVIALDQATGEVVWDFQTVEDDFWGDPALNGGGGVFYPPAIDPARGLTFWGTGNPIPFPGTVDNPNASSRPGPNLYSNSLLALDHQTGELVWYNQVKPHDLFGRDFQLSPVLATVTLNGEAREIVIGAGNLGRVVAFDRDTGEELWDTQVGLHQNDELKAIPEGETITVYPGARGGVETPIAYADNTVYVAVNNLATEYDATGFGATTAAEAADNIDERVQVGTGSSQIVALDAVTGAILWTHDLDIESFGGVTVINDVLFVSTLDGRAMLLSREDGAPLWTYQASAGITAWPAVSQDTIVVAAGAGEEPMLLALRLNGQSSTEASGS